MKKELKKARHFVVVDKTFEVDLTNSRVEHEGQYAVI